MKTKVKRVKIILSTLAAVLILLIVIPIVLLTSLMMFMLWNSIGPPRLNLILVILSNRFIKISKKKFTFDVAKCDKIFDELHKASCIKMSHTIPHLDELKQKLIAGGIIPFLMLLMIAIFSVDRSNRPLMKDD
jgi:hypothetical protein